MVKLKRVSAEMKEIRDEISQATKEQDRKKHKLAFGRQKELLKRIGASQTAAFWNIVTVPLYLGFFFALRKVIYYPEIYNFPLNDAFLWMSSGSIPDPYLIFPLLTGLSTYFSLEYSSKQNVFSTSFPVSIRKMKFLMPLIPVVSLVGLSAFPAGFSAYLLTIALANLFNIWLFQTDFFARINKIPKAYPDTKEFWNLTHAEQVQILAQFNKDTKNKALPLADVSAVKPIQVQEAVKESVIPAPSVKVNTTNLAKDIYRSFSGQKRQIEPQIITMKLTREGRRQSIPKRAQTAPTVNPKASGFQTISDVKVFVHQPKLKPNKPDSNQPNNSL